MSYISHFFGWAFKSIFDLVKGLVMWTIRQVVSFIRFAIPHALRLVLTSLGWAFRLTALSIIALFKGVWPTAVEVAEHWVQEVLAHGGPSLWERQYRTCFRILAVLTIFAGWAIILFTGYHATDWGYELLFLP